MRPVSTMRADDIEYTAVSWQTRSSLKCKVGSRLDQSAFLCEETLRYLQVGVLTVNAALQISDGAVYSHKCNSRQQLTAGTSTY